MGGQPAPCGCPIMMPRPMLPVEGNPSPQSMVSQIVPWKSAELAHRLADCAWMLVIKRGCEACSRGCLNSDLEAQSGAPLR